MLNNYLPGFRFCIFSFVLIVVTALVFTWHIYEEVNYEDSQERAALQQIEEIFEFEIGCTEKCCFQIAKETMDNVEVQWLPETLNVLEGMYITNWELLTEVLYVKENTFALYNSKSKSSAMFITREIIMCLTNGVVVHVPSHLTESWFTTIHPILQAKYILVTSSMFGSSPGAHATYLNDDKLLLWYGTNTDLSKAHNKFVPIPLGADKLFVEPLVKLFYGNILNSFDFTRSYPKSKLAIADFHVAMNEKERKPVKELFCSSTSSKQVDCMDSLMNNNLTAEDYTKTLAQYKFCIIPPGISNDSTIIWHAILVSCVPILKSSTLDLLFKSADYPVIIVNDWKDIDLSKLDAQYKKIQPKFRKIISTLFIPHWRARLYSNRISSIRYAISVSEEKPKPKTIMEQNYQAVRPPSAPVEEQKQEKSLEKDVNSNNTEDEKDKNKQQYYQ